MTTPTNEASREAMEPVAWLNLRQSKCYEENVGRHWNKHCTDAYRTLPAAPKKEEG